MKPQSDRDNKGKPRMSILPTIALEDMLDLEGVDRYDDRADYEREIHAFLLSFFNRGNFDNLLSAAKMALDWTEMACTGCLPFRSDPHLGIQKLIQVGEAGAVKYDAHNWRKGNKASQFFDCALRHHEACFVMGNDIDPEDGCYHAAKIVWNCLVAHELNSQGRLVMDLAGSHYERERIVKEFHKTKWRVGDKFIGAMDRYYDNGMSSLIGEVQTIVSIDDYYPNCIYTRGAGGELWAWNREAQTKIEEDQDRPYSPIIGRIKRDTEWKVGDKFIAVKDKGFIGSEMESLIGRVLEVEAVDNRVLTAGGWAWMADAQTKIEEPAGVEDVVLYSHRDYLAPSDRRDFENIMAENAARKKAWSSQREPRLEKDFREQATEEGSINA